MTDFPYAGQAMTCSQEGNEFLGTKSGLPIVPFCNSGSLKWTVLTV
jgi:hypothetical protein